MTRLVISVELRGLEPLTPCMPCRCATSCATAPRTTTRIIRRTGGSRLIRVPPASEPVGGRDRRSNVVSDEPPPRLHRLPRGCDLGPVRVVDPGNSTPRRRVLAEQRGDPQRDRGAVRDEHESALEPF